MRRACFETCIAVVLVLSVWCELRAEEEAPTWRQVLDAHHSGDVARLEELATAGAVDPWIVAEELLVRNERAAANAYAAAAAATKSPRVAGLPAYVRSQTGREDLKALDLTYSHVDRALRDEDPTLALKHLGDLELNRKDVITVRLLLARGFALEMTRQVEKAAKTYELAITAAKSIGWHAYHLKLADQRARLAMAAGDSLGAMIWLNQQVEILEVLGEPRALAAALTDYGNTMARMQMYGPALEAQNRALELHRELGDSRMIGANLINIGVMLLRLERLTSALEHFEEGLELATAAGDPIFAANATANICLIHRLRCDWEKALTWAERSLAMQEEAGNARGVAGSHGQLAEIHRNLGHSKEAKEHFEAALKIARRIENQEIIASLHAAFGQFLHEQNRTAEAVEHMETALAIRRRLKVLNAVTPLLRPLADMHAELGNKRKALEYYEEALKWTVITGEDADAIKAKMKELQEED